jgi:hypothetical protein
LDEKPVVLHVVARADLPAAPGRLERRDYEYVRRGTADLFMLVAPHLGWRHIAVTARRTQADYAEQLRYLADKAFPAAPRIRLVQDNLNTHTHAVLYAAFPPAEATGWQRGSRCTTRPSMAVGSTWPRSRSASCNAVAWRLP